MCCDVYIPLSFYGIHYSRIFLIVKLSNSFIYKQKTHNQLFYRNKTTNPIIYDYLQLLSYALKTQKGTPHAPHKIRQEWLTLDEAAEVIRQHSITLLPADLIRHALHGDLSLSVYFP